MMRIQLHLSDGQNRQLRARARQTGVSRAELIRQAIDLFLTQGAGDGDPLTQLIGAAGPVGQPDLSEHHDAMLYAHAPLRLPRAADRDEE
jgi:hypothetical protein